MFDTAIFDMDGTLLNTLEDIAGSVNYVMGQLGLEAQSLEKVRASVGNGAGRLMACVLPGGREDPRYEQALQMHTDYYEKHCQIRTRAYEGIPEVLRALKDRSVKTAIVSNKGDGAVQALARMYFPEVAIAVGEREGIRRKPWPDTVREALRQLGCSPERAVYVGDSEVDFETARNAGMTCVLVSWGFRERALLQGLRPDYLIDRPEELLTLIG